MAEEGRNLLHARELPSSGPEAKRLVIRSRRDEGVVVPETRRVGHRRVPLREQVLELVRLKVVGDCLVAAIHRGALTLPSLRAQLLSLHHLHHLRLHRRVIPGDEEDRWGHQCRYRQYHKAPFQLHAKPENGRSMSYAIAVMEEEEERASYIETGRNGDRKWGSNCWRGSLVGDFDISRFGFPFGFRHTSSGSKVRSKASRARHRMHFSWRRSTAPSGWKSGRFLVCGSVTPYLCDNPKMNNRKAINPESGLLAGPKTRVILSLGTPGSSLGR